MSLLEMFFPRARKLDPTTSQEAAQSIKQVAPIHMQLIHECLHEHGPMGKDSIAMALDMNPNQVSRRLPEMASFKPPLVELTGRTVKSNSGRQEREWRAL
jgi:predicted ArsR family transcriptional regulator